MYQPEHGPFYEYLYKGPPKIALVGTCCVGKSTLVDHFSRKYEHMPYPDVGIVPEAAADYFTAARTVEEYYELATQDHEYGELPRYETMWDPRAPRTHWRTQYQILSMITHREDRAGRFHKAILCDRAVVCPMVYVYASGDRENAHMMMNDMYWWIPTYSHICLLDANGVDYQQTPVRSETSEERLRIHNAYQEFFHEYGIPYSLISGSLEERISQVGNLMGVG